MSKNYDQIATVTIELNNPLVDDTSFDNLLLIGPLPKAAPEKAPQKVGQYNSFQEVTEAGWTVLSDDPDPIGLAAQLAFTQNPTASTIFIAPLQLSDKAVASGKAAAQVAASAEKYVTGEKEPPTNCTLDADMKKRVLTMTLSGALSTVKNTGLFLMAKDITEAGYTVEVEDTAIKDLKSLQGTTVYQNLAKLKQGDPDVQFTVHVRSEDGADMTYGVIVRWPNGDAFAAKPEFTAEDLGDPAGELEPALLTVQRAMAYNGWYVVCPAGVDSSQYEDIATYIETQEKMFCYTELGFFNNTDENGDPQPTVDPMHMRTLGVYARESTDQADEDIPVNNQYMNVALVTKWLNYAAGSETVAFKALQNVYPSDLSALESRQLADAGLNYFISIGNKNITMNGKVLGGEWADVIRFRDWLKNDMQVRVVSLFLARPKVPFTDPGISLVQNLMIASLEAGRTAGGIAPDEYDADGNVIPGYTTSVPTAASLTAAERSSRRLTNCRFTARLAGAIHFVEIKGSLGYEI